MVLFQGPTLKIWSKANLVPATLYRFSVRCRTIQSNDSEEFWSEFSNVTIATKPDGKFFTSSGTGPDVF